MKRRRKSDGIPGRDRNEATRHEESREHGHALRYTLKSGAKRLVKPTADDFKKAERRAPARPARHGVMDNPGDQMTG